MKVGLFGIVCTEIISFINILCGLSCVNLEQHMHACVRLNFSREESPTLNWLMFRLCSWLWHSASLTCYLSIPMEQAMDDGKSSKAVKLEKYWKVSVPLASWEPPAAQSDVLQASTYSHVPSFLGFPKFCNMVEEDNERERRNRTIPSFFHCREKN